MSRDKPPNTPLGVDPVPAVPPPPMRRRLGLKQELSLALMPTVSILLLLAFVEPLTQQRLLKQKHPCVAVALRHTFTPAIFAATTAGACA